MSGKYKELYSYLVYLKLKETDTTDNITYNEEYGTEEDNSYRKPSIQINDCHNNVLKCWYNNDEHKIDFSKPEILSDSLAICLEKIEKIWDEIVQQYGKPKKNQVTTIRA